MANKYLALVSGRIKEMVALVTSSGAADAGKIPALDGSGKLDSSLMPSGLGVDSLTVNATEALSGGDLVNLYDNSGALGARKADASSEGKEANGYVKAAVASSSDATVFFSGQIPGLSGLTAGKRYYLDSSTPSGVVDAAPSSSGNVVQHVGVASGATTLEFRPHEPITVA
jgi:hypothetical protein